MNKLALSCVVALGLAAAAVRAEDVKVNFEAKCAGCHGKNGKGETKMGEKMGVQDFTEAKVQAALKDEEAFKAVKEGFKKKGKVVMKPYADKFSDAEIKALVAYIRDFKKAK